MQTLLQKFETGDFDFFGRASLIDDKIDMVMLEQDSLLTTLEIAVRLNSTQ